MMFDIQQAVIMNPGETRMKALRWLLRAAATEGMQHYEKLRCICVRNNDIVCADGFRLHVLNADDFMLGDDAENLADGVYRVLFVDNGNGAVFIPQDVKYPDYRPIEKLAEDGEPGYAKLQPRYLLDALNDMDAPAQIFVHEGYKPAMIVGEVGKIHAVAIMMPMAGDS